MDAIAVKVIEKLSSLALKEFRLIWNLKDDQQRMKRTITAVKAVLLDAEAKASNRQISNWLEEMKDVLFDADDLLDDFSTEAFRRKAIIGNKMTKEVNIFFSWANQIAFARNMSRRMKEIRKRLDDIANDKQVLQFTDHRIEPSISYRERRQTYSFVSEREVIGREKEKSVIVSYLLGTNVTDNVSVIPILGIGGLGKTTLAQLVYNDNAVRNYFELMMWVCVSDEFDIRKIAQKMIGHNKNCGVEEVQQDLRKKIEGKKYLLVLDDVWSEDRELWLKLKSLLMEGGKGSMIIVTTRSQKVAKIMSMQSPIFLKGLDLETSWRLFCQVAFDEGKEPNDLELVAIGRDIVKKCAGVPLAIRTIGSLLYSRNLGRNDWMYFRDVEFSKIGLQKDEIFAILKLSYDHLPSFLKNCFAYCSLFPKDFMFEKNTLIQLWVAEGFIQLSENGIRCAEDVGHEYFMNLVQMSFFKVVATDDWADVTTCKMHDLIHDLALLVAGKEYAVVGGQEVNIGKKTRYLSNHIPLRSAETLSSYLYNGDKLRTFHVPSQPIYASINLDQSYFDSLLSLKCLRVLTLRGLNIISIPQSIKELKHLRYADLSCNCKLKKLPSDITSLHNLQTLKLSECLKLTELPVDINKMMGLRHLELNGCMSLRSMPCGLGELAGLQTLPLFIFGYESKSSVSELGGLNNLRGRLEIKQLNSLRDTAAEVESAEVLLQKRHLQELELRWWSEERPSISWWRREEEVTRSPWSEEGVINKWLELAIPEVDRGLKDKSVFLPEKNGGREDEMILQGLQPHHSIKRLVIDGFCGKRLPDWIGNLTQLLVLEIINCNGLSSLPEGVRNLRSLRRLCIYSCPQLEKRCARNRGEEWQKIAHIATVLVAPFSPFALKYLN